MLTVTVLLGIAPLIDGLVALIWQGSLSLHHEVGIFWVEPILLSALLGLLTRKLWRAQPATPFLPAGYFYIATIACGLTLSLVGSLVEWGGYFPSLLKSMWTALPYQHQAVPEYTLRAGLLLLSGPACLWLVRRAVSRAEDARRVWFAWLVGACGTAGYGIWAWLSRQGYAWPRVESLLDDVNSYGSYLVLTIFVAWSVFVSERSRTVRGIAVGILAVTVWMLFLSGSRIAILAAGMSAAGVAKTEKRQHS
jgi:hypothetical protein